MEEPREPAGELREEFEDFYLENFDRVARSVYLVVGTSEDAFDLTQESFARTWGAWNRIAKREHPIFFTLRVAANLSRSHLRRVLTLRRILPKLPVQGEGEDIIASAELSLMARKAIRELPPRQRWAIVLCGVVGLTASEAASALGVKASTLRVHLARARGTLKETLSGHSEDTEADDVVPVPRTRKERGQ